MNNEDMSGVFDKLNSFTGQNNVSPEMVNNLLNMFNNASNNAGNSNSSNEHISQNSDASSASSNSQDNSFNGNGFNSSGIDFETIMRMKSIIDKMNVKDDPRSNLLQSLKPYLKDSRKSKVDQYIQLMNMSKVMEMFSSMGGDKKNNG